MGPSSNTKLVAGTNTFFLIDYHDIPCHKRKEICHTMVVCKVHLEKDDPDCTCIMIGGNCICFPATWEQAPRPLNLSSFFSTACFLAQAHISAPSTSRTSNSILQCQTLNMSALKLLTFQQNSLRSTTFKVAILRVS